jgi:hypothetical protein
MLTPSVNVVQSSFPEDKQGEISGLSRAVSNLGSSLGTAIAGMIVVADVSAGNRSYAAAMIVLGGDRPDRPRSRDAPPGRADGASVRFQKIVVVFSTKMAVSREQCGLIRSA